MSMLRRRRRRWRVLAASTVVLLVVAGLLGWWSARFPADAESVPGTPFRLEVQHGVPGVEVDGIRAGLRATDGYLRTEVGAGVDVPVQVRVSWSDGCRFLLGPGSVSTAWADGSDFICLNAAHDRWRSLVGEHAYFPAYVAAHEHVHNLQAQLGCFRERDEHEWQWLFEGMADHLAFAALLDARLVTLDEVERSIEEAGGLADHNGTLADYERSSDAAGDAYGLFHLGARALARHAGTPAVFADFCRAVAGDAPWREAFEQSFGISVADLYERVEAERGQLRAGPD